MLARFHEVTVLHPGGERLPILLDADRQPIPWINAYLIKRLRPRLSVVEDILGGHINGALTKIVKVLPLEVAQTFLKARIHAVHDVGPGMCIHDFQMAPCPRHLQCTVNRDEYIWLKRDTSRLDELKRQAAVVYVNLQNVQMQMHGEALVEPDWLRHLHFRYAQLMAQLATLDFKERDLVRYAGEGGCNDKSDPGELEN